MSSSRPLINLRRRPFLLLPLLFLLPLLLLAVSPRLSWSRRGIPEYINRLRSPMARPRYVQVRRCGRMCIHIASARAVRSRLPLGRFRTPIVLVLVLVRFTGIAGICRSDAAPVVDLRVRGCGCAGCAAGLGSGGCGLRLGGLRAGRGTGSGASDTCNAADVLLVRDPDEGVAEFARRGVESGEVRAQGADVVEEAEFAQRG